MYVVIGVIWETYTNIGCLGAFVQTGMHNSISQNSDAKVSVVDSI